jgi:hypothetical protein
MSVPVLGNVAGTVNLLLPVADYITQYMRNSNKNRTVM